jgi:Protein of unknown function, DUF547
MFKSILCVLIVWSSVLVRVAPAQPIEELYSDIDRFMAKHVDKGSVAYKPIQANPDDLVALIARIEAFPYADLAAQDQKAFLINAYNLFTIKHVVDHYPIKSPLDLLDFFDRPAFHLGGRALSLNDIEKKELFARYPDPRMHFVLVCAAAGCPALMERAYRGNALDKQLDVRTKLALDDPRHVRVGSTESELQLSELFSWYKDDFGGESSVVAYINRFRSSPLPSASVVSYIPYEWRLNDLATARDR